MVDKLRIAIFGSYYRGLSILESVEELSDSGIEVVGVATDNPIQEFVSPSKRIWQYPYSENEVYMIENWCKNHDVAIWKDRVNIPEFYQIYFETWRPHICFMGTFGQKIPPNLFTYPKYGFYNFHPCVKARWPSYVGGNPFKDMIGAGETHGVLAFHKVNENWDDGELVAITEEFPIDKNFSISFLHKLSSPLVRPVIRDKINSILKTIAQHEV